MAFMKETPKSLCETCDHAFIAQDRHRRVVIHACDQAYSRPVEIPKEIKQCTSYRFKFSTAPHHMNDIAWILKTAGGGPIGFTPPKRKED